MEPCPMCAGAILQSRISRVVCGAPNHLLGEWRGAFSTGRDAAQCIKRSSSVSFSRRLGGFLFEAAQVGARARVFAAAAVVSPGARASLPQQRQRREGCAWRGMRRSAANLFPPTTAKGLAERECSAIRDRERKYNCAHLLDRRLRSASLRGAPAKPPNRIRTREKKSS